MELLNTLTMERAHSRIEEEYQDFALEGEKIHLLEAVDRILYEEIQSSINVPEFNRSTVDGYAVKAKDTFGASESLPSLLQNIGEVQMGAETNIELQAGECCYVPTGGMLPKNSDGVIMVEYTEVLEDGTVFIQRPVTPKENILEIGEDVRKGQLLFQKGHPLRPQDIGVLSGMGITKVMVYRKPRITIISTGDEIIHPEEEASLGQIKDMNTYSLATAAMKDGCEIIHTSVVEDDLDKLKNKIKDTLATSDILLISGGSSMGTKDITKEAIDAIGDPGVFIHGIAVKPGKPTIVGKVENKAIFGLPGQPVSALVIYQVLVRSFIHKLYGLNRPKPYILGELAVNIPSAPGREHYVMVNITEDVGGTIVSPIHGKSGLLTMMTKSLGYIKIDTNQEGLMKGQQVKVYIF